jgi:heme-degrading monooxygenase HmoA
MVHSSENKRGVEMIRVVIEHKAKDKEAARKLIKVIELVHAEARKQHGFIRSGTLVSVIDPCRIIVLSSWKTPEDMRAWDLCQPLKNLTPQIEENLAEERIVATMTEGVIWREEIGNVFD